MQYEKLFKTIIHKLETGLPAYLTYHNADHTRLVIESAIYLGTKEGLNDEDLCLLKTAALMHDTGFLQNHIEHELLSCTFARKYLPDYNYTLHQVERICTMMLSTQIPQAPQDHLSKILCDADLFYLGSDDYTETANRLFTEFKKHGVVKNRVEWISHQIKFLQQHHFFTDCAKTEREEKKQQQLQHLQAELKNMNLTTTKSSEPPLLQDVLYMLSGVVIAAFALKCFLVPNHFFDGGITGISLLVHEIYGFNLALVIVILNLPLVAASYFSVGKPFCYKTLFSVIMLGICLLLMPTIALTGDKLLISLFGGVFLGIGIGLVMRGGAALDGIEVLALYTLKRTSFTITEIILGINILIFSIAAISFGIETALYSILTYYAATRSIDYVVEGIQAFTGVTIISGKSEIIKFQLVNKLGRGISVYKGERGFLPGNFEESSECDIIFTVITRLELRKLKNLVYEVDPKAFIFANTIKEASGGVIKRRQRH